METDEPVAPPLLDVPSLKVRVEGLVVVIDSFTLNAMARRAIQNVAEVESILIEAEDGKLGVTIRVKKGVRMTIRGHFQSLRLKDGMLGFQIAETRAFGVFSIPSWLIRRFVDGRPPGQVFYFEEDRVMVVNLMPLFPSELSVNVREVVCENGEVRLVFDSSHYRLDRILGGVPALPVVEPVTPPTP